MSSWTRVADFDHCPAGASEHVAGGRIVALFRIDDELFALDGVCPHQGGPLGQGQLEPAGDACFVTCPWHGWQFNVRDGCHRTSPLQHVSLPVKIEDGAVFVELD